MNVREMSVREMLIFLKRAGFTEQSIASVADVNQSTISRILSGKINDPKNSIALAIDNLVTQEIAKMAKIAQVTQTTEEKTEVP